MADCIGIGCASLPSWGNSNIQLQLAFVIFILLRFSFVFHFHFLRDFPVGCLSFLAYFGQKSVAYLTGNVRDAFGVSKYRCIIHISLLYNISLNVIEFSKS